MAERNRGLTLPFRAEAVMVEAYVVCTLGTSEGQVDLPDAVTNVPLGVIQDTAAAVGDSVPVMVDGVTKIVANGVFSKGDLLAIAATTGRVDTVSGLDSSFNYGEATAQQPIGIAMEAAENSGEIVTMLIRPLYFPWA